MSKDRYKGGSKPKNIVDEKFGLLKVLSYAGNSKWFCECSCPDKNIVAVSTGHLNNGHTQSCGCILKKITSENSTTHGMSKSVEYRTWRAIQNRCYNENLKCYKNYGARGIKVCDRWLESFKNFYEDMGPRPSDKYSIDRKNNEGNYEKDNCRWVTQKEQMNNTRSNRILIYHDKQYTLTQLAEKHNLDVKILHERLENGWTIEESISPVRVCRNKNDIVEFNEESLTFKEWSLKINVSIKTIWNRLDNGWSIESTLSNPVLKGKTKRK